MAAPQVNGDIPAEAGDVVRSAFVSHILGYPVIHDGVTIIKSNPYGQKSIQLGDSAIKTFSAAFSPYISKPYQYFSPYLRKADDIGDKTLSKVDQRFPVVTKPTDEIYNEAKDFALTPYRIGLAGKDHVLDTYSAEKQKAGTGYAIGYGRALITTAVVVTSDAITTVRQYFAPAAEAATRAMNGDDKGTN